MRQFTETVRLPITTEMLGQIKGLRRMGIVPTKFMRIAIQRELDKIKPTKGVRYNYIIK